MALLDSITSRANSAATRGFQLAQRGFDQLPGALNSISRDVFPEGTGKRVAMGVARNITSRAKKRAMDAAISAIPAVRAIKTAAFAWRHRKQIAMAAVIIALPMICFVAAAVGALTSMQNNPIGTVVETVIKGDSALETFAKKTCENIKENPNGKSGINCDEISNLTSIEQVAN